MDAGREFEGKSLDEAVWAASRALAISPEDVRYEIVDGGRRGLFGLGARSVKIRVELAGGRPAATAAAQPAPAAPPADVQRDVETTLRRVVDLMGLTLTLKGHPVDGGIRFELDGPDRRALSQKDGELLTALQFVLNRMARRAWPGVGHIQVECAGYRNRREDNVIELAREVARQVSTTGRAKRLDAMNPYERRLVHVTVREFPELVSRSEGEGFLKKITVAPAGRK